MERAEAGTRSQPALWRALWRALRPHQWAKNLLVFVPLVLTPALLGDVARWVSACWAFAAWSAVASAGYLVNDLRDLEADRADPEKRLRPFASGALPAAWGVGAGVALVGLGFGIALGAVTPAFAGYLAVYLVLTVAYSLQLKRQVLVDVLLLAGLYTLRVLAGGAAVDITLTDWLLAFSWFVFLGLAFAKRYVELQRMSATGGLRATGRAYRIGDQDLVMVLGAVSSYLSVLVLCLYITSEQVGSQYARVELLWLLVPILLYWVSRIWLLAQRGELPGDPVAFAVRDPQSLVTVLAMGAVLVAAVAA